jgi:signal transduction histidine kinase
MVQCADSISSSLAEIESVTDDDVFTAQPAIRTKLKDLIGTSADAIDTIQACATHQKRIVDDILTLSKLDSKLLMISPITIQPSALLQDAYKMFKEEANKARVNLEVRCDKSFTDLDIDYAILDPGRVLQVLINLLTNAIKFTSAQPIRNVQVTMGASLVPEERAVEYVPHKASRPDFLSESEWGTGEIFYLHFTVQDTGCGLTIEHKNRLFLRFSQATPKTHVQVSLHFTFVSLAILTIELVWWFWSWSVHFKGAHRDARRSYWRSVYARRRVHLFLLYQEPESELSSGEFHERYNGISH